MKTDCQMTPKEEESEGKRIVVILVGAPGSGKSTFCDNVTKTSPRLWVRVCQDAIANGKSGTKAQCLMNAAEALKGEKSVFIDRCNLEREQRSDFVKLGGTDVDVHAVVLDLPAKLCISRSVNRTGHEGNLQGGRAAAVVNRMLQKKELPKLNEGFSRITFCQNEKDVEEAVKTYSSLGPLDTLPSGCFGQKNPDGKIQLGIMMFLKKVEAPGNSFKNPVSKQETKENGSSCKEQETVASSVENINIDTKLKEEDEDLREDYSTGVDQKGKREGVYEFDSNKKCKGIQDEVGVQQIPDFDEKRSPSEPGVKSKLRESGVEVHCAREVNPFFYKYSYHHFPPTQATDISAQLAKDETDDGTSKTWGFWAESLYRTAMHPKNRKNGVIEISDDVVVLNELYPKAQKHLLVLSRKDGLDRLADVREEHLPLLRTMHAVGVKWAKKFLSDDASLVFRIGYHSVPSMRQLHLHVISQDFNSKYMRNKRHWNSFTTAFFRDSVDVIEEIEKYGKAKLNGLTKTELWCHRCRSAHPKILRLKSHISKCRAPFPSTLLQNDRLILASGETGNET